MSEIPLGGGERMPRRCETRDAGSGAETRARIAWLEGKRAKLLAFLR